MCLNQTSNDNVDLTQHYTDCNDSIKALSLLPLVFHEQRSYFVVSRRGANLTYPQTTKNRNRFLN